MRRLNRREFLGYGGAAAAAAALAASVAPRGAFAGPLPPSERITVGMIGTGVMGSGHVRRLAREPAVELVAICDVDQGRREAALSSAQAVRSARGPGSAGGARSIDLYNDYRDLLARPHIDAVVIATPDHWHAVMAIDAARAGKDIYCEKPVSMTIDEGRRLAQAVRRHGRVFQTGTQYRSIPTIRRVCQFVRAGGLGKVKSVFTLLDPLDTWLRQPRFAAYAKQIDAQRHGRSYAPQDFPLPAEPVPAGLDWELWVGPAPWHPYNSLYHVNPAPGVVPWSFADSFGVASLTWHLSHSTDVIQYALGAEKSGPVELIHPSSGRYPTLTCRYANGTLLHFVDHWGMVKDLYRGIVPDDARLAGLFGGVFVGERGWLTSMSSGGPIEGGPVEVLADLALPTRDVQIGANDHHANFFDCVRSRQSPRSDAEIGHRSASLGHLAMIAYRLGRSLRWDPALERFIDDPTADRMRSRALREPWRM